MIFIGILVVQDGHCASASISVHLDCQHHCVVDRDETAVKISFSIV